MPTYMDRHDGVTVTPEELAEAHAADVAVQAKHGVSYLSYWYDRDAECVFCFVDAPNKAAAEAVHREAHGLTASKIIEVEGQTVMSFLGGIPVASGGRSPRGACVPHDPLHRHRRLDRHDAAPRRRESHGAPAHPRSRSCAATSAQRGGNEVKHTGDGIMASFASVVTRDRVRDRDPARTSKPTARRRTPDPWFASASARANPSPSTTISSVPRCSSRRGACNHAAAGSILVSTAVRELCVGKGFTFEARGPVRAQRLRRADPAVRGALARVGRRSQIGSDLLDRHVDTGRKVESLERVDGLAGDLDDVDQALVDPHLEVLTAVFVDVR